MKKLYNYLLLFFHILNNMGLAYVLYKGCYVFLKKSGWISVWFPTGNAQNIWPGSSEKQHWLKRWRELGIPFFFGSKENLDVPEIRDESLRITGEKILHGELCFFNNQWIWLGKNYDWITNPKTGHQYDVSRHWSTINELDPQAGDIKFVWEKSRFTFLLTIIRYDYHYNVDCSQFVIDEILSWIKHNPVNQGPNWICSQEISLRLMNWFLVLYYYKDHPFLTPTSFEIILQSIYDQVKHVYSNIKFSLKTVRNNHTLTESLLLFMAGHLFPFFKEAQTWRNKGKKWFEQEIDYQIYEDGSYIQYSMNYHRIVIQLLTLAILFSERRNDPFEPVVYDKAKKSLNFLYQFLNRENGSAPNYGNNDGALFFPFNNRPYTDFRSQLNALHYALYKTHLFDDRILREDTFWLGDAHVDEVNKIKINNINTFEAGGYYTYRDSETFTFLRCGKHKDRPGQADNLHLDISLNGKNLFRDAGTYLYNSEPVDIDYFFGTKSHNTVLLGGSDQMKRYGRFIWLNWSQSESAELREEDEWIIFEGQIKAFRHLGKKIRHNRIVRKKKHARYWETIDRILNKPGKIDMTQIWHPHPECIELLQIEAFDGSGNSIKMKRNTGWYAPGYGKKEPAPELHFTTQGDFIRTIINVP